MRFPFDLFLFKGALCCTPRGGEVRLGSVGPAFPSVDLVVSEIFRYTIENFLCVVIDGIHLVDVLVVQDVLFVLHVLWVKINTGTKTTLNTDDLNKYVRPLTQIRLSRIIRQYKFETHKTDDLKLSLSVKHSHKGCVCLFVCLFVCLCTTFIKQDLRIKCMCSAVISLYECLRLKNKS